MKNNEKATVMDASIFVGTGCLESCAVDSVREQRITEEILKGKEGREARAMSWYRYLEENLSFPFDGEINYYDDRLPFAFQDKVSVGKMASIDFYYIEHEMYVDVHWGRSRMYIAIPLVRIAPTYATEKSIEAIGDWHYWLKRRYTF